VTAEHLVEGNARHAEEVLAGGVASEKENPRALLLLGKTREAVGDDRGAVEAYLAAIAQGGWGPELDAAVARDELWRKTYPASADALLRVAARRETLSLWRRVARLCEAKREYEKATALLVEAVRVNPEDVAALSILARVSARQDWQRAADWHRRILAVNPDLPASLVFLAQGHYTRGAYEQAIPYFERLMARGRGGRRGELYWLLSTIKARGSAGLEQRVEEVARWRGLGEEERLLARELLMLCGEQSLEGGDLERAGQCLFRAQRIAPSADLSRLLAAVENKKGERAQEEKNFLHACVSYQRAAEHDPGNPEYTEKAARAAALRAAERTWLRREIGKNWRMQKAGTLAVGLAVLVGIGGLSLRSRREGQPPSPAAKAELAADSRERVGVLRKAAPPLPSPVRADGLESARVLEADRGTAGEGLRVPGAEHPFTHPEVGYAITPPPGFTLVRSGQRTVWHGPQGAQLLVETTASPGPSARAGWEQLHTTFIKKYGRRYRSYGIRETHLAGRPAAAWEFTLATADGPVRKLDVAVLDRGVGYGVLVSAPVARFAAWRPRFEAALRSFRLPAHSPLPPDAAVY
jgi:tetratricopeptide (TPR) repeat protein